MLENKQKQGTTMSSYSKEQATQPLMVQEERSISYGIQNKNR